VCGGSASTAAIVTANLLVASVTGERETAQCSGNYDWCSGKWHSAERFHFLQVVFWISALSGRVIASRRFEGTYRLRRQGCLSVSWLISVATKAVYISPKHREEITQLQGAKTLKTRFLNNQAVRTSNHSFRIVKNVFRSDYFVCFVYRVCWWRIDFVWTNEAVKVCVMFGGRTDCCCAGHSQRVP
jgi:hypothetical protein